MFRTLNATRHSSISITRTTKSAQMSTLMNFVNGSFVSANDNETIDNINPATLEVVSKIPRSKASDVEDAIACASRAAVEWGNTSISERAALLEKVAVKLEASLNEFALAESLDSGKPLKLAQNVDIPRAIANLRFFASAAGSHPSSYYRTDGPNMEAVNYTDSKPLGVVALITPWNLPLYLLTWKIAPALMMGNSIVAKPSEMTPTTASMIADLFDQCGAPKGLLNVLHGLGAEVGAPMVSHRTVKAISFTGGTSTGAHVAVTAAKRFTKASLELGGKNATIVFADKFQGVGGEERLDEVAKAVTRITFLNSGQICLCGSRILVESSILPQFQERLLHHTKQLVVGDPLDATTDIGPVSSMQHRDKVQSYIDLGISEGGTVLCGGGPPSHMPTGAYLTPTLIGGLNTDSRTATEEIFGPVATIHSFETEADAVRMANCTDYGLSASVWTNDLERGHRVSRNLDVGMVWVNTWLHRDLRTAFGGVKDSGLGREGGNYSLDFFSEKKNICIALNQSSPPMPGSMK
mmetsp:Transcript_25418/g.30135  ORF Transcript_25418/g.30135 Transcript_25418/m.30135 type:complete len:524 (+) Transcript_25418:3-1574(+)